MPIPLHCLKRESHPAKAKRSGARTAHGTYTSTAYKVRNSIHVGMYKAIITRIDGYEICRYIVYIVLGKNERAFNSFLMAGIVPSE